MMYTLLGLLFLIAVGNASVCDDPATPLHDLDRRGHLYDAGKDDKNTPLINDRYLSYGWYSAEVLAVPGKQFKLTDDATVPRPGLLMCGTYYPTVLTGLHPTLKDNHNVSSQVCVKGVHSACSKNLTIEIRRCSGQYHYTLKRTPDSAGYCFDREDLKEPGIAAPEDSVVGVPTVGTSLQYYENKSQKLQEPVLIFACNAKIQGSLFFYVDWYVNDVLAFSKGPVQHDVVAKTTLNDTELMNAHYTLGISIKCAMSASNNRIGLPTRKRFSPSFFAGIKVHLSASNLTLKKGEEGIVILENTVPIGCRIIQERGLNECGMTILMYDPNDDYTCDKTGLAVKQSETCGVTVKVMSYETWLGLKGKPHSCKTCGSQNSTLKIITKNDASYEAGKQQFTLRLKTGDAHHTIWNDYHIKDIQVTVLDDKKWERKICSSHCDPHQETADGMRYENHQIGDFVLYRNTEYQIEVQERTERCVKSREIYCPCSVIVRAGEDLFQFSVCGSNRHIGFLRCHENLLDVRMLSDDKYQVHTPIGTYVEIRKTSMYGTPFLNVDVIMSPKDLNKTEGLCGFFDGDMKNDLRQPDNTTFPDAPHPRHFLSYDGREFAKTWKVSPTANYRNPETHATLTRWSQSQILCVCPNILHNATTVNAPVALCSASDFLTCNVPPSRAGTHKQCTISRRRRSMKAHTDELMQRFQLESIQKKFSVVKRSANNVTIDQGMQQCKTYLQAQPVYTQFAGSMPENTATETMIGDCGTDLSYGASGEDLMRGHFEGWKGTNFNEIKRNKTFQEVHAHTVKTFKESACLNDCTENGICTKGVCVCEDGFGGDDCSVSVSDPVDVQYIGGGPLCDRQHDDCEMFTVQGESILQSVSCKVDEVQIFYNDTKEETHTHVLPGEKDSIYAAFCSVRQTSSRTKRALGFEISFVTRYHIYISNDGIHYGTAGIVNVYDSRCQAFVKMPNGMFRFYLKSGYCYIDGLCYSSGSVRQLENCYECDPGNNQFQWTMKCKIEDGSNGSKLKLTIGLAVSGTLVGVAICIGLLLLFKRLSGRHRHPSFEPDPGCPDPGCSTSSKQPMTDVYRVERPPSYE